MARTHLCVKWKKTDANFNEAIADLRNGIIAGMREAKETLAFQPSSMSLAV